MASHFSGSWRPRVPFSQKGTRRKDKRCVPNAASSKDVPLSFLFIAFSPYSKYPFFWGYDVDPLLKRGGIYCGKPTNTTNKAGIWSKRLALSPGLQGPRNSPTELAAARNVRNEKWNEPGDSRIKDTMVWFGVRLHVSCPPSLAANHGVQIGPLSETPGRLSTELRTAADLRFSALSGLFCWEGFCLPFTRTWSLRLIL